MKTLKSITIAAVLISTLLSCSKNNDDNELYVADPQYPLKELIFNGDVEEVYTFLNKPFNMEMGYTFKTFKNGEISALGIRLPDNGSYRVTLWNAETEEVLATKQVQASAGILSFEAISPIAIQSGTTYFVSVNTNDYYNFKNSEGGNLDIFPIESGDILLTSYGSVIGNSQTFPDTFNQSSYLGMVDVKFVPEI